MSGKHYDASLARAAVGMRAVMRGRPSLNLASANWCSRAASRKRRLNQNWGAEPVSCGPWYASSRAVDLAAGVPSDARARNGTRGSSSMLDAILMVGIRSLGGDLGVTNVSHTPVESKLHALKV